MYAGEGETLKFGCAPVLPRDNVVDVERPGAIPRVIGSTHNGQAPAAKPDG